MRTAKSPQSVPRPTGHVSFFRHRLLQLAAMSLVGMGGCGKDPILERAEALEAADATQSGGGASHTEAVGGAGAPVSPAAPPPQDGGVPGAAAPPQAAGGGVQPPPEEGMSHTVEVAGPSVIIGGTVELVNVGAGGAQAAVRIDVFDGDQQDLSGPRPSVVALGQRTGPGPFQIKVPKSSGKVWIGGFADVNGNGRPDHEDPTAWYSKNPVSTDSDAEDVVLRLEARKSPATKEME